MNKDNLQELINFLLAHDEYKIVAIFNTEHDYASNIENYPDCKYIKFGWGLVIYEVKNG